MQELRNKLREAGAELTVYKNSLTEIAMRELALPSMSEYLAGPTAFVFAGEDPVAPAKALTAFAKEHKALELKGGLVENQVVDADGVKAIATLPSREELIAKLLGTMLNPIVGFARVLNGPVEAFARTVAGGRGPEGRRVARHSSRQCIVRPGEAVAREENKKEN